MSGDGAVIGCDGPVWKGQDITLPGPVFIFQRGAGEDVIDAAVEFFRAIEVGPHDSADGIGEGITILFVGASVDEAVFAAAEHCFVSARADSVIEVAQDDQIALGEALEEIIDKLSQEG